MKKKRTSTTMGQVVELSIRLYYAQMIRAAWSIQGKLRRGKRVLDSGQIDRTESAGNMVSSYLLAAQNARAAYLLDKGNFSKPQVQWCHHKLCYAALSATAGDDRFCRVRHDQLLRSFEKLAGV